MKICLVVIDVQFCIKRLHYTIVTTGTHFTAINYQLGLNTIYWSIGDRPRFEDETDNDDYGMKVNMFFLM